MARPAIPDDEAERLADLRSYDILDTLPEEAFDDIARLASVICGTPIGLVSLVDEDRQWFKASVGLDVSETSRDVAFCAHAINEPSTMIVRDAQADERFADNPLVTGSPHIRFYAGAPMLSPAGQPLGTVCAIDIRPRDLSPEQVQALAALSRQVVGQLELRRKARSLVDAEREMATMAARWRLLLESAAEGIYELDLEGRFTFVNRAASEMLGWAPEELIGRESHGAIHYARPDGSAYPRSECPNLRTVRVGERSLVDSEVFWRRDRTPFAVAYASFPVLDGGALRGAVVTFTDITARQQADRALQEAKSVAEALADAKTQFLSSVSHELRTPLTSIIGYTDMLLEEPLEAPQREMLEVVARNSHRLLALIEDLLTLSKLDTASFNVTMAPVEIGPLVEAVQRAVLPIAANRSLRLLVDIDPCVGRVLGDSSQLDRVLLNLVGNAVKFTTEGGAVTIGAHREADRVTLSVADTGIGIPAEQVPRLFDRFFRASNAAQRNIGGSGLGLALVKAIVDEHSGSIRFDTVLDEGTTVTVTLPALAGPVANSTGDAQDSGAGGPYN